METQKQDNNLGTRMTIMEEQIKSIDEKLDNLDKKLDKMSSDICKTYVRKDNYNKDIKALTKETEAQAKRIDAINKIVWVVVSTILIFVTEQVLSLVL